jgi:hypothetical protein
MWYSPPNWCSVSPVTWYSPIITVKVFSVHLVKNYCQALERHSLKLVQTNLLRCNQHVRLTMQKPVFFHATWDVQTGANNYPRSRTRRCPYRAFGRHLRVQWIGRLVVSQMCYSVTLCQKDTKKKLSKSWPKRKKVFKKFSKSCQKVAKSCQKVFCIKYHCHVSLVT